MCVCMGEGSRNDHVKYIKTHPSRPQLLYDGLLPWLQGTLTAFQSHTFAFFILPYLIYARFDLFLLAD